MATDYMHRDESVIARLSDIEECLPPTRRVKHRSQECTLLIPYSTTISFTNCPSNISTNSD